MIYYATLPPSINWVKLSFIAQDSSLLPKGIALFIGSYNWTYLLDCGFYAKDYGHGRILNPHLPKPKEW